MNPLDDLIGDSPGIVAIREQVARLLRRQSDARRLPPILILGETGTGKGLLARALHRAGPRASGPFVDVNCAAIPDSLLEAELFGFERGAFTDARQAKAGLFQVAHRGTIFLDEVGLLSEGLQAKLLTAIEERAVRRLGSTRTESVDVWILAATSEDLAVAMRERRFREDLYHRLAVLTLWLPPVRERGRDVLLLAEHFLARACGDYHLAPKVFSPDTREVLMAYRWPGNVRELANVMERVALLSEEPVVTRAMLGLPQESRAEPAQPAGAHQAMGLDAAVESVERAHVLEALRQTSWNISHAAARLGIPRSTLRYRIEKHGLSPGGAPPPLRRRVEAAREEALATVPSVPSTASALAGLRWESRRLTLLRALWEPPRAEGSPLDSSRLIELLVEKVQSFGGRVEELSPTGILAVFGLEPVEDAPSRAAHAGMAILKAAARARREPRDAGALRLALHVGQFLVGQAAAAAQIDLDAKRQAGAVLETLVAAAEPGTIRVSDAATSLLERRFDLVPAGAREAGVPEIHRLAGLRPTGFGARGRVARFVGRRQELELLRSRLASAMRGHGQVVGIAGEAGIGKSRLLFEFRQSLRGEPVTYLEGRSVSYGSAIPYLPVLEMLRSGCRLTEADTPEAIAEKVRVSLATIGMDPSESAPYLLQLLGIKEGTDALAVLSPEAIKARTFDTLRQMSLRGSRRRPLVVAVEDLHWLDTASEAYFASLVESLPGAPILFLSTYRPGYRPPWMERSYATQMALEPLSPEESLSVVRSILETEQVPPPLAEAILAKAEGNPFFLEELALAVRELGELRPTLAVPDTVQEVLLARIHRLADEPKRLLQTASVLGRAVSLRLLGAIWQGPGELEPHLQELKRLEFLHEQIGAEEPVYLFRHPLTQEVASASLPDGSRQALHEAAGRALEALYADRLEEVYDRLAYHYSKTAAARKAAEYLTYLADKAARVYAHEEAVTALGDALAHVERLPADEQDRRLLDLSLRLAHSLSFLGRFQETLDLLLRQQERLERLREPALSSPYSFWLAHTYSYLGDQERAATSAQRALDEAALCGDEATMGKVHFVLAQESYWAGEPREGIEHARRAVELLERAGERWWLGLAHWVVGINHVIVGEFGPALAAEARALAIGEALGDPRLQSYAAWSAGWVHALRGEWEAGIEACRRGLERSPDPVNTAVVRGHLGYAYLEKGDVAEAIALLEESVEQLRGFGFRRLLGRFLTFLGEAYLQGGQLTRARELVSQGVEITRDARYWYGLGWAQLALGRVAQAGGDLSEAEAHVTAALETLRSIQARFLMGWAYLTLAELSRTRDRDAAAAHLREAHQLFRALGVPRYLERTRELAGELGLSLEASAGAPGG
jgi:transcriptional regulator with AAA-type ATPase domain/tetratricopeptide (TPR) repeat protein